MEVRAAVAPAVQVHTADIAERQDRALGARHDAAEVGGQVLGQVAERIDVLAARDPDGAGQAAADRRVQRPVLVRPDGRRRLAAADPARRAAGLTAARRLGNLARSRRARNEWLFVGKAHVVSSRVWCSPVEHEADDNPSSALGGPVVTAAQVDVRPCGRVEHGVRCFDDVVAGRERPVRCAFAQERDERPQVVRRLARVRFLVERLVGREQQRQVLVDQAAQCFEPASSRSPAGAAPR